MITELRPREYAAKIIDSKSKKEKQRIVASIPAHLKAMVREHVKTYDALNCRN